MNAQTRRRGVLQMFGITLGALSTGAAAGIGKTKPDTVTQAELRQLVKIWNQGEALGAQIRQRLEGGAELERGSMGVSTLLEESIAWHRSNGGIGTNDSVAWCGLKVASSSRIGRDASLLAHYPDSGALALY
jgi:hypothetical protein